MRFRQIARAAVIVFFVVTVVLGARILLRHRAQRKRDAEYASILKTYSDALKPGANRQQAESYVHGRGATFVRMCCVSVPRKAYDDLVRIGEDDPPWYCSRARTYVAFEFEPTEPRYETDARSSDELLSITLSRRLEECL